MTIRPARLRDLEWLASRWATFCHGDNPDVDGWVQQTADLMGQAGYVCRVLEDEGLRVGFLDGTVIYDPALRALCFVSRHSWIDEDRRGKGFGMALYKHVYDELKEAGVSYLVIESEHAQALCEKMTGEKMETHSSYKIGRIV